MMAQTMKAAPTGQYRNAVRIPAQWCRSNGSAFLRTIAFFVAFQPFSLHVAAQPPSSPSPTDAKPEEKEPPSLTELVTKFLKDEKASGSAELMQQIRKQSGDDATKVSAAIREAKLWEDREKTLKILLPQLTKDKDFEFEIQLPDDYNPAHSYPVLVKSRPIRAGSCFMGAAPLPNTNELKIVVLTLRPSTTSSALLEYRRGEVALDQVIPIIRRLIHTKDEQIHLLICEYGWNLILDQPGSFASAVIYNETPKLPYARQMLEIRLPNLRSLAVSAMFIERSEDRGVASPEWTSTINRAIAEIAANKGQTVELVTMKKMIDPAVCGQAIERSIASTRPLAPKTITHWFRTPSHGRSGWLRQTRWAGDVPNWDQISILPGPKVDHDKYITDVLKSQMAYIGGTLEGNKITIETRRCESIEVLLFDGMVDFSKPVEVTINGKHRHDKVVRPSVPTLLSEFAKTWDLQRLVFAKLSFDIREDAPD